MTRPSGSVTWGTTPSGRWRSSSPCSTGCCRDAARRRRRPGGRGGPEAARRGPGARSGELRRPAARRVGASPRRRGGAHRAQRDPGDGGPAHAGAAAARDRARRHRGRQHRRARGHAAGHRGDERAGREYGQCSRARDGPAARPGAAHPLGRGGDAPRRVGPEAVRGHVAQLARAFGMQVVGHDPYLSPERAAELQVRLLPLEQLLRQADVVTLHVAHTEQTHHLINAERLKLMKPTAVLVNTARGELVDDAALADAVRDKRIGGAAIDVFAVEPLPADAPLRKLERVILTPHLAASTAEAQQRVSIEICGAVRDALLVGDLSFAINVPGISGDLLRRLGPLLDLARRLGRLALALVDGPVTAVEVDYGGKDDAAPRPVLMAAVEGLLSGMGVEPVSLVNAPLIAEERGIRHARRTGTPEPGFEITVGVTLETPRGRARVAGALVGNSHGRVIRIDDYHVDVAPEGWMLVIRNRDVPGVIGRVGTLLGGAGINIGAYHQARLDMPGHDALAAITVDQALTNGVLDELARVPEIQQVRLAHFGD